MALPLAGHAKQPPNLRLPLKDLMAKPDANCACFLAVWEKCGGTREAQWMFSELHGTFVSL